MVEETENKQPTEPTTPEPENTNDNAGNSDKGSEKTKDDSITLSKAELSEMIKKRVSNAVKERDEAQKEAKRLASLSDDDRAKEEIKQAKAEAKSLQDQVDALKLEQQRYKHVKQQNNFLKKVSTQATQFLIC